jgi:hypothetical protein
MLPVRWESAPDGTPGLDAQGRPERDSGSLLAQGTASGAFATDL